MATERYEKYRKNKLQPELKKASISKLSQLRLEGNDPAHGGEAARKRGRTNADHAKARQKWEAVHGDGEEERKRYVREVLPKLKEVPLSKIMQATGFSKRYVSLVKKGEYIPHPVHYAKLIDLIDGE